MSIKYDSNLDKCFKKMELIHFSKNADSSFATDESTDTTNDRELSNQARDLLAKILVINPKKRITIDEALQHPYIKIWSNKEDGLNKPRLKLNEFVDKDYDSIEDWKELIYRELGLVMVDRHFY